MSDNLKNTAELREQIAQLIGQTPESINMMDAHWLRYMQEGVILSLHVGRWRARTKLELSDLGLPQPEDAEEVKALDDLLVLGRKNLLPTRFMKKFDAIESGARKYVNERCFKTHWGAFCPADIFNEVTARLAEFRSDYFETMQEMVSDWEAVRLEWMDEYRALARKAYRTLNQLAPDLIEDTEDEFVRNFINSIRDLVPPAEQVEASFSFAWDVAYIPLPSILEQDRIEVESRRRAAEMEWQERSELSQMRAEVARQAQAQKRELIGGFMKDLVVQLRQMVYEACTDVLSTMQNNDRLHPRSVVQLRNLIDQVGNMNFFGDEEITHMINQVKGQLVSNPDDRDAAQISRTLQAVGTVTRNALIGLGETPRSGRAVGIADVPNLVEIRSARASLDLSNDAIPVMEVRSARKPAQVFEAAMV